MTRRAARPDWYALGWQTWMLGLEASSVVAARMFKFAAGGDEARIELDKAVSEKVEAGPQLQAKLLALGPAVTPATAVKTALNVYKGKVTANRRRLSR